MILFADYEFYNERRVEMDYDKIWYYKYVKILEGDHLNVFNFPLV